VKCRAGNGREGVGYSSFTSEKVLLIRKVSSDSLCLSASDKRLPLREPDNAGVMPVGGNKGKRDEIRVLFF